MLSEWTANQRKFIEWLATPPYQREPKEQQELAEVLKVHYVTLTRWKKLDGFQDAVTDRAKELLGSRLPNIYGALADKAEFGDVPAIRLVMEMTGQYTPASKQEHTGQGGGPIAAKVEHKFDSDSAESIFGILEKIGAFASVLGDAETE